MSTGQMPWREPTFVECAECGAPLYIRSRLPPSTRLLDPELDCESNVILVNDGKLDMKMLCTHCVDPFLNCNPDWSLGS